MKPLYWWTTSVIKVYGWYFFPPGWHWEIIYLLHLPVNGWRWSLNADAAVWREGLLMERSYCAKRQVSSRTAVAAPSTGMPCFTSTSSAHAGALLHSHNHIHSVLTTLCILWHITGARSTLSGTKTLIIGLIAMATSISPVTLWW